MNTLDLSTLKPGDAVAIVSMSGWGDGPRVVGISTVTKVGKRDLVLSNGSRWSVLHNAPSGGSAYSGKQLALPGSDLVLAAEQAQRQGRIVNTLRAACQANDKRHLDPEALAALRKAVSAAEAYLAEQKKEEN